MRVRAVAMLAGASIGSTACGSGVECGPGTYDDGNGVCLADRLADVSSSMTGVGGAASSASSSTASSTAATSGAGGAGGNSVVQAILDALPPCKLVSMDGSIDFSTGCVEGACGSMTYDEINAALGEIGACDAAIPGDPSLFCQWAGGGIEAIFDDVDMNGVPDAGKTAGGIFLSAPFAGGTKEGLGIGATMRCFIDVLGIPTAVTLAQTGTDLQITELQYGDFSLLIDDGFAGIEPPDGTVDHITMFSPVVF